MKDDMKDSILAFREKLSKISCEKSITPFEYCMAVSLAGSRDKGSTTKYPYIDFIIAKMNRQLKKLYVTTTAYHEDIVVQLEKNLTLYTRKMIRLNEIAVGLLEKQKGTGIPNMPHDIEEEIKRVRKEIYFLSMDIRENYDQLVHDFLLLKIISNNKRKKTEKLVRVYLGLTDENIPISAELLERINAASKLEQHLWTQYEKLKDLYELIIGQQPNKWHFFKTSNGG